MCIMKIKFTFASSNSAKLDEAQENLWQRFMSRKTHRERRLASRRNPVWEFCDATCAHLTVHVCFIQKASANNSEHMTLKVSWERGKFMESHLFCWDQSHNCINCWAKCRWCRLSWCRLTQRWRSDYCIFLDIFFEAYGIQANTKMQDKKYKFKFKSASCCLVCVYLWVDWWLRRGAVVSTFASLQEFIPKFWKHGHLSRVSSHLRFKTAGKCWSTLGPWGQERRWIDNRWMDGWLDGWMVRWMDGWLDEHIVLKVQKVESTEKHPLGQRFSIMWVLWQQARGAAIE